MFHLPMACWSRGVSFYSVEICSVLPTPGLPCPLSSFVYRPHHCVSFDFVFAKSWNLTQENSNTFSLDSYKPTILIFLCNKTVTPLSSIIKLIPKAGRYSFLLDIGARSWSRQRKQEPEPCSSQTPCLQDWAAAPQAGSRDYSSPQSSRRKRSWRILWWKSVFHSSSPYLKSNGIPSDGY